MSTLTTTEPQRIHPHRFIMWVAIGSIVMMFAGMTSAYIVKKNQGNWLAIELPVLFWYSTAVIVVSSLTMLLAQKAIQSGKNSSYRAFVTLQWLGFKDLELRGIALIGAQSNSASSFLFVITGLHMFHVIGGVIALIVVVLRAFWVKTSETGVVPVQIVATYWHFVDILWIYLFIFYQMIA